ncbi:unnamed protein product [Polarella glacialis]|uniref:Uncharacterized protein n=1 Tax=Polarella glacialis TaxID=89957 RepID=A0A813DMN5_POLGL|nr:unnamed protein product [Polarella glacialis]
MAPHRFSVPLDRGILEALARVEGTDGLSGADICENFEAIHTILEHCDPRMVAKYFIEGRPVLFDTILENCRMDVVPFDVNVNTVVEFINAYHFLKLDLDPSDRVRVKEHRLTVHSMETAMLMLPELQFGANRELTVAFYFAVDDFGEEESDEKRFGFIFNTCRVFFSPEQDSAGIDQFRKVYIDWGIKGHEPERHDLSFSFLRPTHYLLGHGPDLMPKTAVARIRVSRAPVVVAVAVAVVVAVVVVIVAVVVLLLLYLCE